MKRLYAAAALIGLIALGAYTTHPTVSAQPSQYPDGVEKRMAWWNNAHAAIITDNARRRPYPLWRESFQCSYTTQECNHTFRLSSGSSSWELIEFISDADRKTVLQHALCLSDDRGGNVAFLQRCWYIEPDIKKCYVDFGGNNTQEFPLSKDSPAGACRDTYLHISPLGVRGYTAE